MIRPLKRGLGFVCALSLAFLIASCGASSDSSTSSSSSSSSSSSATTATITGTVGVTSSDLADVSNTSSGSASLSAAQVMTAEEHSAALASIDTDYSSNLPSLTVLTSGTAYLQEIRDCAVQAATESVSLASDGTFTFSNVLADKKYVVTIVKTGYDSQGQYHELVMDRLISLDSDETSVDADITVKSRYVMLYLLENVFCTTGTGVGDDTLEALTELAVEAYNEAVQAGRIRVSSATSEATDTATSTTTGFQDKDTDESETVDTIANDSEVASTERAAKLEAQASQSNLSASEAKEMMRQVFGLTPAGGGDKDSADSGGGGSIPDFFLEIFADAYLDGITVTIAEFASAYNESIISANLRASTYATSSIVTDMSDALSSANSKIRRLYSMYDSTTLNYDTNVPPAAIFAFPRSPRVDLDNVSGSTDLTVPQAILLMGLAGLMDEPEGSEQQEGGPHFDPMIFLELLGYVTLQSDVVYLTEAELRPEQTWNPSGNAQAETLTARVMLWAEGSYISTVNRVVLQYPTATGNATRNLTEYSFSDQGNPGQSQSASLSSIALSQSIDEYNASLSSAGDSSEVMYVLQPWSQNGQFDSSALVTNFVAGTANIYVYSDSDEMLASTSVRIYKPTCTSALSWTFPEGPNMDRVEQNGGWDPQFQPMSIELGDGESSIAPTLKWSAPSCTGPSGTHFAYAVNLGINSQPIDFGQPFGDDTSRDWDYGSQQQGYKWDFIYSTMEDHRFIRGTTFHVPSDLAFTETARNTGDNYMSRYEANVNLLLIESASGRVLWRGQETRTEFTVDAYGSNSWSVTLNGTVTFPSTLANHVPRDSNGVTINGSFKVGLFQIGHWDNVSNVWVEDFWNNTAGERDAVTVNGVTMVADLGDLDAIAADSFTVDYTLPAFTNVTNPISQFTDYTMLVWYDYNAAPTGDAQWTAYGTANSNAIDIAADFHILEHPIEHAEMGIWSDHSGIRLHSWRNGRSYHLVEDEDSHEIDFTIGRYWGDDQGTSASLQELNSVLKR